MYIINACVYYTRYTDYRTTKRYCQDKKQTFLKQKALVFSANATTATDKEQITVICFIIQSVTAFFRISLTNKTNFVNYLNLPFYFPLFYDRMYFVYVYCCTDGAYHYNGVFNFDI